MMAERRRHSRTPTRQEFPVLCSSLEAELPGRSAFNVARKLIDVSAKGACLVTSGRLRQGLPVSVELTVPGTKERVRLKASVRWSTTVESKGRTAHVAGLEFDQPAPALAQPGRRPDSGGFRGADPQRRHKRFHPPKAEVVCLPRDLLRAIGFKKNAGRALKDLSLGGAQIVSTRPLKPGQRVDLALSFRYPTVSVTAEGLVRWCRRDTLSLEKRWFVGVVFKQIDPASDSRLKTVEALLGDTP